ncbi:MULTISPECIES: exodeoxyribonuclease V subunit gamma [unclassified Nocardioides]|uniref:exodeoxyribonuclease V subunit gamma n=1 Tax=unclassified Nocardioides TaxID=2615069 RepID=UPI0009F1482B|nr:MULTISPECIES: exodeoxyribonuclease V subunit gamma [unclassified Nocardioides]GAW50386.1 DNA helicase/exodeoxyribonuclease V subunit gamma [Nocardioides sp. PD653-B2]GAW53108.1 DNA helicase/exodeoxyribonuclease V subunit gamma [Nocardioides sp. PD653]
MTLRIHRAARTDALADRLGEMLAAPLDDPFAEEVVVVPEKGIERWLTQRLSHRLGTGPRGGDGVCAGVRFLRPTSLVSLLLGRDRDDPWDPERLVWPLLAAIDDHLDDPAFATLAAHLGHGRDGADGELRRNRRYSVAIRLAHLFASYARQRPSLVTGWREGRDGDLADDLRWQAELWRRLLPRVDAPPPDVRHADTCRALAAGGAELDLPGRLSLFGHTRIPVTEVELLAALGEHRDVHLFLPQPSPVLWDALAGAGGVVPRDEDTSSERVGHPLLASLGRDARELRRTLDGVGAELVATPEPATDTLLGRLQHDLRANHAPSFDERAGRRHDDADRSLQVHACHGPARQIDVLREVLVGMLQDDPTLEPRDILVMCPDIETYAPLISAGFGLATHDGHPAHELRVKLADRALSSTNPLLAVADTLLELAGGRVTAADVLDLAGREPVRRRFGLTDDDLDRVSRWVARAGVRWGIDEASRAAFQMERFPHNTWRMGLDRILLGVAMSGDDHRNLGRGLPLDDVASFEIDLAGRLAELVSRLDACLSQLHAARTVADWTDGLRGGVRALTDVTDDDAWQLPQFERELARAAASSHEGELELRLPDVRALLQSRLAGRPTRANFRTGTLTVCTMVPMRSVPHRVVCLVGLDDGVFPRAGTVDGDDVLGRRPRTGERDARSEDRQLLLDAVMAATEHLVITYTGADEQSGARRPPAVPLGEILDAADRTTAAPVRDRIEVRHPLQPYDARNFARAAPFSFDTASLAGARSAWSVRREPPPLLTGPLAERPREDVSLQDLKAFLVHPVRSFLRERLDVSTPFEPDDLADAIPVALDNLEKWKVGDHLLTELLAGQDATAVMTAEQLRGTLPPGGLGTAALAEVVEECQKLWARSADVRAGERRSVDVDVDLGGGRRLTGTVPSVYGTRVVSLGYSRLKARQRLLTWVDLLALSASHPDQHWTAHAIGRERAGPKRALSGPIDHRATDWLRELVDLRERGLREPLPVPIATGAAWAEAHVRELMGQENPPAEAARRAWETDPHHQFGIEGEDADPFHQRVFGSRAPVEVLLDAGLGEHAWRIWEPLLTGAERVGPL